VLSARELLRKLHWYTIRDHNVFYPASALSMMVGCFMLGSAMGMEDEPVPIGSVLLMMGVMHVYELMLIGLAIYLLRVKRLWRDGRLLLIAEAIFLVDIAQLNAELVSLDLVVGMLVNAAVLVLAVVKVIVVVRGSKMDIPVTHIACVLIGMAMVLGWPAALTFHAKTGGVVTPWIVYAWWWTIAALITMHGLLPHRSWQRQRWGGLGTTVGGWMVVGVYASLFVHAYGTGWVHHIETPASFGGPVYVALGLCAAPILRDRIPLNGVITAELMLPLAGIAVSLWDANTLTAPLWDGGPIVSPLRVVLFGAAAALVLLAWRRLLLTFAATAAACVTAALLGHSVTAMLAIINELRPRSRFGWGVAAMTLSFILLGVGALCSFRAGGVGRDIDDGVEPTPADPASY